jgi:hypothetical protein
MTLTRISLHARKLAQQAPMLAALLIAALDLTACVAYAPVPAYSAPASFDRSWSAAVGALQDQGVTIDQQDRAAGVVRGTRGGVGVIANVRTQADGSVRVQFDTTGATAADPTLIDRISSSYDRRMGR